MQQAKQKLLVRMDSTSALKASSITRVRCSKRDLSRGWRLSEKSERPPRGAPRSTKTPRCGIRRGGMISAVELRKLRWHKQDGASGRRSFRSVTLREKGKQVVDPASAVKGSDHNRCQWDVRVRQSYKAMNPMSREIADTNFLETKIHSSKYIMAKT
jgi:hypothetical protein